MAGLDHPTSGRILIGDRDVTNVSSQERDLAMVFQSYALYPHKTVRENLAFGPRMRGRPAAEIAARVADVAAMLQIDRLLDRRPAHCREDSASAWRSAGRLCASRRGSSSTSRSRIWTPAWGSKPARN